MATSERTIEEVRRILGKLDRSISEARQRRLGAGDESVPHPISNAPARDAPANGNDAGTNGSVPNNPNGPGNGSNATLGSTIGHSTGPRAGSSGFGRAKPLGRPNSLGRWGN
ncbi:MAG: hypothetical protein AAF108_07920 [Planctomycetota bacterium]